MKIIILGAGVIGVTTAYFLAKAGHEVTVIDREPGCAKECSFANGGQLSYSHVEPWANPTVIPNIIKWLGKKDAPLVFRLRADYAMWRWGMKFLLSATHRQSLETTRHMLRLSFYSREVLHELYQAHPLAFSYQQGGIIHVFHDQKALDIEIRQATYQKELGHGFSVLDRAECLAAEPALAYTQEPLSGGLFFPEDEMGNVYFFTTELAALCEQAGVKFLYGADIQGLLTEAGMISGVKTSQGIVTGDHYIMALGAQSPLYTHSIGVRLPVYPMKGYSISIPVNDGEGIPTTCITDQTYKIVYSRLENIIRVAGTAEFAGYDTSLNQERIIPILNAAKRLFPRMITADNENAITRWACLRPSTPHGMPVLGKTRYPNLLLNTGHGTLGWTLACGSARIIADMVEGRQPEIDMTGFLMQ